MKKRIFSLQRLCCFLICTVAIASTTAETVPRKKKYEPTAVRPSISKVLFGEIETQQVFKYTLKNSKGMLVQIINYGAAITDIIIPDKDGKMGNVVLGFDSLKSYSGSMNALMGAVVGRVANRIADKKFTLDGKEYTLSSDIHGGINGFNKKIWVGKELPGKKEVGLKLNYFSKDGDEGFPGNLQVSITYILTNNNELKINYTAATDQATPVVLTNHSYFNLSGGKKDKVLDTEIKILAHQYLESDNAGIPTGIFIDVKGTPFDFTLPQKIGTRINENNKQLQRGNGYDIAFVLNNPTGRLIPAVTAYDSSSGRAMDVYTTEPGLVFYTGNHLSEGAAGRNGKPFTKNGAFCLETQHFPDSPNRPAFPNCILRPGEKYQSQTVYKFYVVN